MGDGGAESVSEARELSALSANFPVGAPSTLTQGDVTRERGFTCVDPGYRESNSNWCSHPETKIVT